MRILLIDDDDLYRGLASKALSKAGHAVVVAVDGEKAIEQVRNNSCDLIITDLFMPRKEGIEVIQELRTILPAIKIIAISSDGAAGHSSFLKIAQASGADATLQKPFTPAQLLETVRMVTLVEGKKSNPRTED